MAAVPEAKAHLTHVSIASLDSLIGRMASAPRLRIIEVMKRAAFGSPVLHGRKPVGCAPITLRRAIG